MTVYDGNQLPEAPTSVFQMVVSVYYTVFVSILMAMGAFAVLAAQKKLDKELPGNLYMQLLINKHKSVARGLLAFIPSAYSLAHLYTSSLHNGSLYSASNIFYVAVFGFSAQYLGKAFIELVDDSIHMDSIKAVYECLYMMARCLGRLSRHPAPTAVVAGADAPAQALFASMGSERCAAGQELQHLEQDHAGPAWLSPWAQMNIFLAIAAQDDSRSWAMFFRWLGRADHKMPGSFVPTSAAVRHNPMKAAAYWRHLSGDPYTRQLESSYAYWLYSQGTTVRDFTGSFVMNQNIPAKLNMAGFASRELYTTAHTYMCLLGSHFQQALGASVPAGAFNVECWDGVLVDAKRDSPLVKCLRSVNYKSHGLEMACERYVCRKTPACAAFCLPAECVVKSMDSCWQQLFNATPALQGASICRCWEKDAGYWCGLWLAYLHMVLLGVDILRMFNNRKTFDANQQQCGFFNVFKQDHPPGQPAGQCPAQADITKCLEVAAGAQESQLYPDVHNMHEHNLYGIGALLATLLLAHRMQDEGLEVPIVGAGGAVGSQQFAVPPLNAQPPKLRDANLRLETLQAGNEHEVPGLLQSRTELVESHSSLPAIVHGTKCMSAAEWVQSLLPPLGVAILVVAVVAVTLATISCSYGVYLVSFAGLFQSFAAWCLLQCLEGLPVTEDERTLARYAHAFSNFARKWLFLHAIRLFVPWMVRWVFKVAFYCVVQVWTLLWLLLLTFFNFAWFPILTWPLREFLTRPVNAACYLEHFMRVQLKGATVGWSGFWKLLQGQWTGPDPAGATPGHMPGIFHHEVGEILGDQLFRIKNHSQQVLNSAAEGEKEALHATAAWLDSLTVARPINTPAPGRPVQPDDLSRLGAAAAAAAAAASVASTAAAAAKAADVGVISDAMYEPPEDPSGIPTPQHGTWLKDALVSLRTVKSAAQQMFKGKKSKVKRMGIGLASCFSASTSNKHLYRHRISLGDIALHVFICWSCAFFAACVGLALYYEPYYTTPTGMCLGRCHDKVDCQSNLTLGLPMFEGSWKGLPGQPVCPGLGAVVFDVKAAEDGHQCPTVVPVAAAWELGPRRSSANSPVWLRVAGLNVSSSIIPSGTEGVGTSMCNASAKLTVSATGLPIGSGTMVKGDWSLCKSPASCSNVLSMAVPTDPQGVASFQSPDLGGARWLNCTFNVTEVVGYKLNATSFLVASAVFPA